MGNPTVSERCGDGPDESGSGCCGRADCSGCTLCVTSRRGVSAAVAGGVSLLERLLLGVLFGLLATALLPQFLSVLEMSRQQRRRETEAMVRSQIRQFQEQHQGRLPAQGTESASEFLAQLCRRTTISGQVEPDGRFGPCLLGPVLPGGASPEDIPSVSEVLVVAGPLQPCHWNGEGAHEWVYSSTTGQFRANPSAESGRSEQCQSQWWGFGTVSGCFVSSSSGPESSGPEAVDPAIRGPAIPGQPPDSILDRISASRVPGDLLNRVWSVCGQLADALSGEPVSASSASGSSGSNDF